MKCKIGVLQKGDRVFSVWDNHFAIQKPNGDVEVYQYYKSDDGLPKLTQYSLLLTEGNGEIVALEDDGTPVMSREEPEL